jgi:hypothetical protein
MGCSLSSAAVKDGTLQMICDACDLRSTGEREEVAESSIDAVEISGGWYPVLSSHRLKFLRKQP